jgi:hypothetical protein
MKAKFARKPAWPKKKRKERKKEERIIKFEIEARSAKNGDTSHSTHRPSYKLAEGFHKKVQYMRGAK